MENIQQKFKEFILNDIFWFNKSELNFGIYKIFRQKEQFIKDNLELIVSNIEKQLSNSNDDSMTELKEKILECIPPKKAKELSFETNEDLKEAISVYGNGDMNQLLSELSALTNEEKYDSTKVYEYLYQFFNLYYEKGDFGYTPRSFKTYTVPYKYEEYLSNGANTTSSETSQDIGYKGEETLFTWKTKDSYYIKSNKFLNSVSLNLKYNDVYYNINTNIIQKDDNIKDDKKIKQYRLISIEKEENKISLNFNISDFATPKHTIYLMMLSVINQDIKKLDYDSIFQKKELKTYFEILPFNDTEIQTSLFDENQAKVQQEFKSLIIDENLTKYLLFAKKVKDVVKVSNIFSCELSGEEDKTQLKSKVSKLMISKKDYVSKLYTKTSAKEFLNLDKKDKFELDDNKDIETLFEKDENLEFFYRLDRGTNMFLCLYYHLIQIYLFYQGSKILLLMF